MCQLPHNAKVLGCGSLPLPITAVALSKERRIHTVKVMAAAAAGV